MMEDSARQPAGAARTDTPKTRRVPAYFTMYLLNELLSSLRLRQRH